MTSTYLQAVLSLIALLKRKYTAGGLSRALNVVSKYTEIKYQRGNRKIGRDTIILNMGMGAECPSALLGMCELAPKKLGGNGKCYDLKATRMYPTSYAFKKLSSLQ